MVFSVMNDATIAMKYIAPDMACSSVCSGSHRSAARPQHVLSLPLCLAVIAAIAFSLFPGLLAAGVIAEAPAGPDKSSFNKRVKAALESMEQSQDAPIRRLHAAAVASRVNIVIRPMTDDPATWHADGDRNRPHTEPADKLPKSKGRTKPTGAIIFITPDALDPDSSHWSNGVLVHELVHAIDLAYGRYNSDYTLRERRAVFMQNIWRARLGFKLRTDYHGRFSTLDYQDAIHRGSTALLTRYVFTRSDFPSPPSASHPEKAGADD
jgi:hypothetical protein